MYHGPHAAAPRLRRARPGRLGRRKARDRPPGLSRARAMRRPRTRGRSSTSARSPSSTAAGTRPARSRQGRWRSALVGEIVGVLADQSLDPRSAPLRGGARVDPVAMQVQLGKTAMIAIADAQRGELSPKLYDKIVKAAKSADEKSAGPTSASTLGLGGIPPTLEQLAGVACTRIVRTHVLSLATLRQVRFGAGSGRRRDVPGAARRARARRTRAGQRRALPARELRPRRGRARPASPSTAGPALSTSSSRSTSRPPTRCWPRRSPPPRRDAGVTWSGQVFAVDGDPDVIASADDSSDEE